MNLGIDNRIIIGILLGLVNGLLFGAALHSWWVEENRKIREFVKRRAIK